MATKLKEVDAVMVGVGFTGSILARELTKAGLQVVGLERGPDVNPTEDYALPRIRDELKYFQRLDMIQDPSLETLTLRHSPSETALPIRRFGSFLPGNSVGGAANHWGGQHWRFLPSDHELRSHLTARYGKTAIPDDMTIEDWGVTYAELEPYYDQFERLCGVSGQAGNINGRKIDGGNIFEGPRSRDYPTPPLKRSLSGSLYATAAAELGYHPFPMPASTLSEPYTNPEGVTLGACQYCGHCERFGCEANAKAGPHTAILPVLRKDPKFELRAQSWVSRLIYDKAAKKVRGVVYTDTRTGEEYEQPAGLVVLSAYVFGNASLLLHSHIGAAYDPKTGKGTVGRNYCYQVTSGVQAFFENHEINAFMGAGAQGITIDDFNGDNFDHSGLGFFGGAYISCNTGGARPIAVRPVPPGTPRWGSAWKKATAKWYNHAVFINVQGSNYAHRNNYLDLDPTYRDALGRPLLRMTYNFVDNDHKMSTHLTNIAAKIAKAMNPTIVGPPQPRLGNYSVVPYQSTHNTGGTIMGRDPHKSVVNRYLQAWDADNLFIMGASVFPQNAGYNPTGAVGALAYWAANAITTRYLKSPGPLVHA
jgi:gluconate 2-dehydrogenase alpha chain